MTPTLLNNRYQIIRVLGSGGFGETFLAHDIQMPSNRRCVIKQLKPVDNNPQVYQLIQQRFQREAMILEQLGEHNHQIPRLYAYFAENGLFYLVQEYIEGETLLQKVQKQGYLKEAEVKEILINILPVLDYIHGQRIIHRDIKPDNIILRASDNKPVLIDFGAVKISMQTDRQPTNSDNHSIIGTPGFMSSEQSIGRATFSSDIYSLGLTAVYLLTGRAPQEIPSNQLSGEYLWQHLVPEISYDFADILDKAIKKSASDRYIRVKDMQMALQPKRKILIPPKTINPPPASTPLATTTQNTSTPKTSKQASHKKNHQQLIAPWQQGVILSVGLGMFVLIAIVIFPKTQTPMPVIGNQSTKVQPLTKIQAQSLVTRWLNAKKVMFAPPYDQQIASELTTGSLYRNTVGADGEINHLQKQGQHYKFGEQKIESVERFFSQDKEAMIEIKIREARTLYDKNSKIIPENTSYKENTMRYTFKYVDQQWKISSSEKIK